MSFERFRLRNATRNVWETIVRYSGVVPEGTKEQGAGATRIGIRAAAWLAWSLAGLSVAMFVATGVLDALARSARSSGEWFTVGSVSDAVISFLFLAFPIVGALIASRRPRNPLARRCPAAAELQQYTAAAVRRAHRSNHRKGGG